MAPKAIASSPELLAALLGLAGAAAGYWYRELQNRSRPFFRVLGVNGDLFKRTDVIEIPQKISDRVADTFYVKGLSTKTTLGDLYEAWKKSVEVEQAWSTFKDEVNAIIASSDDQSLADALASLLSFPMFELWVLTMLLQERVTIPKFREALPVKVPVHETEDYGGTVWFGFHSNARSFGRKLSNRAIRAACEPLIRLIEHLDADGLHAVFTDIRSVMEVEYGAASGVSNEMNQLLNHRSRWAVSCYFANLSTKPIILENRALLRVWDRAGLTLEPEECYLAVGKGEKSDLADLATPLVVAPQHDVRFVLLTSHTQEEMSLGDALREAFDKKTAEAQLTMTLNRVGLLPKQRFTTRRFPFVASADNVLNVGS